MKKTNRSSHDELNLTNYSAMKNILYCLNNTVKCHFPLLCWCSLKILIGTLIPILTTILPKIVIEMITAKQSVYKLASAILSFMGSLAILSGADKFLTKLIYHHKFRMNTFYLKHAALKGLTTDYINQENGIFRKLQTESFECCNGNYSPLSNIYEILIKLCTSFLGLSVFGSMLIQIHWGIIIFLIITTVISYYLNQKIIAWTAANNKERIGYQQRLHYINDISGDIRSAKDIRLYKIAVWFSDIYNTNMKGIADWYKRFTRKLLGIAVYDSSLAFLRESIVYFYLLYLIWNGQITVAEKMLDKLISHEKENQSDIVKMALYPAIAQIIIVFANAVCYLFVASKALFGAFGVGNIVQYVAVLSRLGEGLQELMYLLSDNEVYCTHLQNLFAYLDLPNHMYQGSLTVEKRDDNEYYVEFKNVSFQYPNADAYALKHVNLKFKVGEKLAVVGMNGSGKTTFIKLMCRLYDPTEGEILLNGVNIKKYDYNEYTSIFSVVFQDFRLFSFSLGQNVSASASYDEDKVIECLKKTGFAERLNSLPNKLNTFLYKDIDADGVEISGGEAQKLALARALYKNAPFIILDEPTAALDPISEYEVYSKFNEIAGTKTAIYISHRLASCRFCDKIAVFHEGEIIQLGSHEELLADSNGKYYELWNAQAQYYTT